MAEIAKFPAMSGAGENPENDPVVNLRKAIARCIQFRGSEVTAEVIAYAMGIENSFDWRARARRAIGDKKP